MRQFPRLTSRFSKTLENLEHSVALLYMLNNFCRIHPILSMTPAMEIGIADHVLKLEEVILLLDSTLAAAA
ncbi:MAG: hypothetical protein WCL04_08015 [Verrucomicrobiota bacterium]